MYKNGSFVQNIVHVYEMLNRITAVWHIVDDDYYGCSKILWLWKQFMSIYLLEFTELFKQRYKVFKMDQTMNINMSQRFYQCICFLCRVLWKKLRSCFVNLCLVAGIYIGLPRVKVVYLFLASKFCSMFISLGMVSNQSCQLPIPWQSFAVL